MKNTFILKSHFIFMENFLYTCSQKIIKKTLYISLLKLNHKKQLFMDSLLL